MLIVSRVDFLNVFMILQLNLLKSYYESRDVNKILRVCNDVKLIQVLYFWTSVVLFFFLSKMCNVLETGFVSVFR